MGGQNLVCNRKSLIFRALSKAFIFYIYLFKIYMCFLLLLLHVVKDMI
jgi:hypothetical protein